MLLKVFREPLEKARAKGELASAASDEDIINWICMVGAILNVRSDLDAQGRQKILEAFVVNPLLKPTAACSRRVPMMHLSITRGVAGFVTGIGATPARPSTNKMRECRELASSKGIRSERTADEVIDVGGRIVAPSHIAQRPHYDAVVFWSAHSWNRANMASPRSRTPPAVPASPPCAQAIASGPY